MVRRIMVPIFHMRGARYPAIETLKLYRMMPEDESQSTIEEISFNDFKTSDRIFDAVQTKCVSLVLQISVLTFYCKLSHTSPTFFRMGCRPHTILEAAGEP